MKKAISVLVIVLLVVPSLVFGFDTKTFQIFKSQKPIPYCLRAEGYPEEGYFATLAVGASSDNGSQEAINIASQMMKTYIGKNYELTSLVFIYAGKIVVPAGTLPRGVFVKPEYSMDVDKINEMKELLKNKPAAGCPPSDKVWKMVAGDCTYYLRYHFPVTEEKEMRLAVMLNGTCSAESLEEEANKIKEFMIGYVREMNRQNK